MKKTYVLLESQYLTLISKYFGDGEPLRDWDINQFAITLAKCEALWCDKVFYYTAPPYQSPTPTPDEIKRRANHDRFISKIKKIGVIVREGRCQRLKDEEKGCMEYHQKGVDTYIIMDLLDIQKNKPIESIIIVTSDTDFVPILNELRKEGIRVILYYFSDRERKSKFTMSNILFTACDKKQIIKKEHFLRSMKENRDKLDVIKETETKEEL